ncbi:hypothetical protein [Fusobacterium sp.]|nr:hypothetical protein [Fusobacterium sp.]
MKRKNKPNNKKKYKNKHKYISVLITVHNGCFGRPVTRTVVRVRVE